MISVGSMRNPYFNPLLYIYYCLLVNTFTHFALLSVTICATPFPYPAYAYCIALLKLYFYQHFLINLHAHCMFVLSLKDHKHHKRVKSKKVKFMVPSHSFLNHLCSSSFTLHTHTHLL